MNEWNLYLLYQALANAYYETEGGPPPPSEPDERWRNQTFYVNLAAGLDSGHLQPRETGKNRMGIIMPAALAGLEWHFHPHLSLELDAVKPRFINDTSSLVVTLAAPLVVKGVFKPGGVMLEPYAGIEGSFAIGSDITIPAVSVVGGVQLGFQAGTRSAWTIDAGVTRNLIGALEVEGNVYDLLRVHIMAGWKVGFKDRPGAVKKPVVGPSNAAGKADGP
jgi:hypothetical protein